MDVRPVDPRDTTFEIDRPRYRVSFTVPGSAQEVEVVDADVDDVLAWAAAEAGEREYSVSVVVPGDDGAIGLIRLR